MSGETIKVGVLIVNCGVQLLDLAAVDVLGSCDPQYLKSCSIPDAIVSKSRPVEVLYIAESGAGSNAPVTSNGKILVTVSDHLDLIPDSLHIVDLPFLRKRKTIDCLAFVRLCRKA